MAADHLIITGYVSGVSQYASYDPSDILDVGLSSDGYVTIKNFDSPTIGVFLFRGSYSAIDRETLGEYFFPVGTKTKLTDAYPGIDLPGCYLWSSVFSRDDGIQIVAPYTSAGAPTSPKVDKTVSRDAVTLSWGAGSAGTNNAVTGYDVQYQDSADGVTWPSSWTTASGSPVTANSMNVSPPTTVEYYRRFRVRTRGSAGSDYYSGWVISTNVLRRKWNAFGAWTDPTLSVGGDLRAVHMTEMQERIKTIRSFYGLSAAAFTTITGGVTLAADWADHIAQIRTAIDGITTDHAAWITATAGEPAIAVMNQLRNIIDSL